ncbi:paralemmin-3 isoform X2 [Electrophorus electricus]|nr:paralemmin-3 isoform X2 [Electrophorus electricus]
MDETEKYQQRLRAIAEKLRVQEEQERAKREVEDEKLRLQQLKRKSLRDQWLMDGPPLSPDSAGPRSPLWGPEAQEIEAHVDKLQGVAAKRLQTHMEDDSVLTQPHTEAFSHKEGRDAGKPVTAGHLVQGGQEKGKPTTDGLQKVVVTPSALPLTNGAVGEERSHSGPQQDGLAYANGFPDGPITLTFLGFSDVEPGQGVCDDDDSSTIIHAERVIITDEGDEITELPKRDKAVGEHAAAEEDQTAKVWNHLQISVDPDCSALDSVLDRKENNTDMSAATSTDLTRVSSTATSTANNTDCGTDTTASGVVENPSYGVLEGEVAHAIPALTMEQFRGQTVEGHDVSPILELFRMQCSTGPVHEPALHYVQVTPLSTNKFQETPLNRAGEGTRQRLENEPLLASKAAPLTDAACANRAEGADAAKMKTCRCCSVM